MSITAAIEYDKNPHSISKKSPQGPFDNAARPHHLTLLVNNGTQTASANDGEALETFEFVPPYDQKTDFNKLLDQIEDMRWSDPIGAANRLLQIDTQNLPSEFYNSYRELAQDLSAQLQHVEGSIAQITLWDLRRSTQDLENLFGRDPDEELTALLGENSMQSLHADIADFIIEHTENDSGLPDNAGIIAKMATLQYKKLEAERLDALPKPQMNREAYIADERRRLVPALAMAA